MPAYFPALEQIAIRLSESFAAGMWQGAVISAGCTLMLRWARGGDASLRFRVWAMSFAGMAALAGLPLLAAEFRGSTVLPDGSVGALNAPVVVDARWSLVVAGLWAAVSLYRLGLLGAHVARVRRIWMAAKALELSGLQEILGRVTVCESSDVDRPGVIGFFRPRILLPTGLAGRLTADEVKQLLLHEMEHLRRRDDWTNLAQKLLLAVFPLHLPLLWAERQLCREREIACDEGVVRQTMAPRAYASCLARLAEERLQGPAEGLSLGAWRRRSEVVERVHALLRRGPRLSERQARVAAVGFSALLIVAGFALAHAPQMVAFASPAAATVASAKVPTGTPNGAIASVQPVALKVARKAVKHAPKAALLTDGVGRDEFAESFEAGARLDSAQPAWVVLTDWQPVAATKNGTPPKGMSRPGTVVELIWTVPVVQHPRVAAVPVEDGWLVFQL